MNQYEQIMQKYAELLESPQLDELMESMLEVQMRVQAKQTEIQLAQMELHALSNIQQMLQAAIHQFMSVGMAGPNGYQSMPGMGQPFPPMMPMGYPQQYMGQPFPVFHQPMMQPFQPRAQHPTAPAPAATQQRAGELLEKQLERNSKKNK